MFTKSPISSSSSGLALAVSDLALLGGGGWLASFSAFSLAFFSALSLLFCSLQWSLWVLGAHHVVLKCVRKAFRFILCLSLYWLQNSQVRFCYSNLKWLKYCLMIVYCIIFELSKIKHLTLLWKIWYTIQYAIETLQFDERGLDLNNK